MITNFEQQTSELTIEEQRIVQILINRFKSKPGKLNEVTNKKICQGLEDHYKIKTNEARIRKVINFIRVRSLLPGLVATSNGYYLTNSTKDLEKYILSLKEREEAIKAVRIAAENDLKLIERSFRTAQNQIEFK